MSSYYYGSLISYRSHLVKDKVGFLLDWEDGEMEREEVREAKKEGGDGLAEQEERRRRVENWQNRFDGESVRLLTDSSTNSRCPRPIERNPEDYRGGH